MSSYIFVCQVMKIHQKQKCCLRTFLKIRDQMKTTNITQFTQEHDPFEHSSQNVRPNEKTTTSFRVCLSLEWREQTDKTNRQTGFFANLVLDP